MYKSILASALITLSASSAFALDFSALNNAIANSQQHNPWTIITDQIKFDLKYVSQLEKHRRNGATQYNAETYAAFDAADSIGYDGSGVHVLINDDFRPSATHGRDVKFITSVFANGANLVQGVNANSHRENDTFHVINESFGSTPITSGANALDLLNGSTWAGQGRQPQSLTNSDNLDQLRNLSTRRVAQNWGNHNSLFVTGAANDGADCSTIIKCNHVLSKHVAFGETFIAVGALNDHGTDLDGYSNRAGIFQDYYISAPVAQIGNKRGTSFAAPIVTAAAAVITETFGTNAVRTRDIILNTADDLGAPGTDAVFGRGRLNVHRALSPIGALR